MVTFKAGKKMKNRKPKDLEKFRKMKVLSEHLASAMNRPDLPLESKYGIFFEIAFKFGNIHAPNLNELYLHSHPWAIINIPDL